MGPYLAAADIFVCTSRIECYPRVNQEAMAFGLPIITTPVFGIREQVWEDRNAFFYPPGDVRALARHLGRLADDPELRRRMGESGLDVLRTLTRFDEDLELYGRILREAWLSSEAPPRRTRGRRSGPRRRGRRERFPRGSDRLAR